MAASASSSGTGSNGIVSASFAGGGSWATQYATRASDCLARHAVNSLAAVYGLTVRATTAHAEEKSPVSPREICLAAARIRHRDHTVEDENQRMKTAATMVIMTTDPAALPTDNVQRMDRKPASTANPTTPMPTHIARAASGLPACTCTKGRFSTELEEYEFAMIAVTAVNHSRSQLLRRRGGFVCRSIRPCRRSRMRRTAPADSPWAGCLQRIAPSEGCLPGCRGTS